MGTGGVGRFSQKLETFANSDPVIKVGASGSRKFEFGGKQVSLNHIIEEFEKEFANGSNVTPEKAETAKKILIRLKELKTNQSPVNNIFSSAMKHLRETTNRAFGREERLEALNREIFRPSEHLKLIKKTLSDTNYKRQSICYGNTTFLNHEPDSLFLTTHAGKAFAYIDEKTNELRITGMSRDLKTAYHENIGSIKDESRSNIKNLFLENLY